MQYFLFFALIFLAIYGAVNFISLMYIGLVNKISDILNKKEKASEHRIINTHGNG